MTIQEFYDWAVEKNIEDYELVAMDSFMPDRELYDSQEEFDEDMKEWEDNYTFDPDEQVYVNKQANKVWID